MAQGIINELSLFLVCTPESLISKEYALLLFTHCLSLSASDMFPLTMCASLLVITNRQQWHAGRFEHVRWFRESRSTRL